VRRTLLAALWALGLSVVVLASTTVGQDTFTEGSNTALPLHTPDTGTSWTEAHDPGGATITVSTGGYVAASGGANTNHNIHTITPNPAFSSADYDVSITVTQLLTGNTDKDPFLLIGRYADSSNYYAFGVDGDTSKTYALFEKVGGTVTVHATAAITMAANDVLKFSLRGDTLKVYQNGGQLACAVDASLSAAGSAGLGWGNASGATWGSNLADVNVGWRLDSFLLDDFTGEGGDDNCAAGSPSGAPRLLLMGVGRPW
jgi:hypothetical protein